MDLSYPSEAEEFRKEIRAWLEENLPEGWGRSGYRMDGEERKRFNKEWSRKLYAGGWICASWPEEYGGKGLDTMQAGLLHQEVGRPRPAVRARLFRRPPLR